MPSELLRRASHPSFASRIALTSRGGKDFTYADLLAASRRLAVGLPSSALEARGRAAPSHRHPGLVRDVPRLAVLAPPGPAYMAATLATWRVGGIAVPVAPGSPARDVEYVLADSGVSALLTTPELADQPGVREAASKLGAPLVLVDGRDDGEILGGAPDAAAEDMAALGRQSSLEARTGAAGDSGALIIYTSGTTGRPKGVLHSHGGLMAQMESLAAAWQMSPSDRLLHVLPLHHIHGIVNALYLPLSIGATVDFSASGSPFSPKRIWARLCNPEPPVTVFMGVPTMYDMLATVHERGSSGSSPEERAARSKAAAGLRLTVSGSSACPVPLMQRWRELSGGQTLLERYGMSEIGMALSNPYLEVDGRKRTPGAVGAPLPGVEVAIDGSRDSESGELLVRGPGIFAEYWNLPEKTAEAFTEDGFFRTGDTARQLPGGAYQILGRTSVDVLKCRGFKVSALAIEAVVLEHPAVAEVGRLVAEFNRPDRPQKATNAPHLVQVAVIGLPDERDGQVVAAVIALKPDAAAVSGPELTEWLRPRLPSHEVPKEYWFVPSVPRNAMGKVNKKDLYAAWQGRDK